MSLSNREKKRLMAIAINEKAMVHVGRDGIRARVIKVFTAAFTGSPCHHGSRDVIRVKVHPGCTMDHSSIVDALCGACDGIEYVGCQQDVFFVFMRDICK